MNTTHLRTLIATTVLGLGLIGNAQAAPYTTLDTAASQLTFGYSQMNVNMEGAFKEIQATQFNFDPEQPDTAQVTLEIPLSSIDAGYDEANTELEKDEWLSLANHPLAGFQSDNVEALSDGTYQVTGQLSIKGHTLPVTAPFTFTQDGDTGIFEGSFTFQRADYAIGEGSWKNFSIVANDISVNFRFVALP